ncbi:ABC-type transport auxiliary lipoprotein family protein [Microbacteriaceae bacterium K1510]|nr:ABC-type transport auxiliary lipoprotein family protein [Microbacteriaceae bacterium K1510]
MENTARYTLIGVFTLACLFGAFAFIYWIKNVGGFGERSIYTIRFEQPVSGLTEGASVLFNGIRAGAVSRIALDPDEPKRVTATISVDPAVPVRADTQVDIAYLGLTGAAAVLLKGGSRDAPRLTPQNGQPPEIVAGAGAGRTLSESAQDTLRHIDDIMSQNAKPLNTAITGIATFADMLGRNAPRVEGLIGGLEKLTGTGTPAKGPAVFDLVAASDFPAAEKRIAQQLVVPDPNVLILFDSQKILTRAGDGTYGNIANAQWADNLPKLVEARLVQSFENAQQLNMVSRPIDTLNPAFRLETTIRSFYIATEPEPQAVVEVTARLVSDKGDVAAARVFSATVPAKSVEAPDAVAALNEAFAKVAGEMVTWTVDSI